MSLIRNIKSLQMFHAIAQTRNLSRTADVLKVSQSSLSYHIKKLEDDLSVTLFRRTPSGLELTEAGALLAAHVDSALSTIRMGLRQATMRKAAVRFALLPMFSTRWLSSRLAELLDRNPDMHLTVHSHQNDYAMLDRPAEFADLGMQWGRGNWERFHATRLWPERMLVVCSPEYRKKHAIETPADIQRCTLLHVDDHGMWEEWFRGNGLDISVPSRQMMLEDRHFQVSSTINGIGVSLFADWLVAAEIESGALVSPFACSFETDYAYHLIYPRETPLSPTAQSVHDSIIRMAREDRSRGALRPGRAPMDGEG